MGRRTNTRAVTVEVGSHPRVLREQKAFDRPHGHHLAIRERGNAVAHRVQAVEVVGDHEDCGPTFCSVPINASKSPAEIG